MPWSPLITNIVTQGILDTELLDYYTALETDNLLDAKLDADSGTASNLKLSNVGIDANSAVDKASLDSAVSNLSSAISLKADKNGTAFTGIVTVPLATAPTHAVRFSQLDGYLKTSGGPVSNAITYNGTISSQYDLVTKGWVESITNTKADATATTNALASKAPIINAAFTGIPTASGTLDISDNSTKLATTEWVKDWVASQGFVVA
jgi:hypothetical protein